MEPDELAGEVAVVTGAASGIGLAIAERCARAGMKVVLADVETAALDAAAGRVGAEAEVLAVVTDVSQAESVDALRDRAEAFGTVSLVCNNAGVGGWPGPSWELAPEAWRWVLGVNVWGVINGMRAFLPGLIDRDAGYLVNMASVNGHTPVPFDAPYAASKHAVVGITTSLHHELKQMGSKVHVSLLCPGGVDTQLRSSTRNWPSHLGPMPKFGAVTERILAQSGTLAGQMPPAAVADELFEALDARRFWVLPNAKQYSGWIRGVAASAVEDRDPPMR